MTPVTAYPGPPPAPSMNPGPPPPSPMAPIVAPPLVYPLEMSSDQGSLPSKEEIFQGKNYLFMVRNTSGLGLIFGLSSEVDKKVSVQPFRPGPAAPEPRIVFVRVVHYVDQTHPGIQSLYYPQDVLPIYLRDKKTYKSHYLGLVKQNYSEILLTAGRSYSDKSSLIHKTAQWMVATVFNNLEITPGYSISIYGK